MFQEQQGVCDGEVSFQGKGDGDVDTAHMENGTEGANIGEHQGQTMIEVVITDIPNEEGEDPAEKEEDISHDKNHQKPVEPCFILYPGQEADTKNVDANTNDCQ